LYNRRGPAGFVVQPGAPETERLGEHGFCLRLARLVLGLAEDTMKDLLFTLVTVAFFGAAWLYARACERL
jgi:hypothetical protein